MSKTLVRAASLGVYPAVSCWCSAGVRFCCLVLAAHHEYAGIPWWSVWGQRLPALAAGAEPAPCQPACEALDLGLAAAEAAAAAAPPAAAMLLAALAPAEAATWSNIFQHWRDIVASMCFCPYIMAGCLEPS